MLSICLYGSWTCNRSTKVLHANVKEKQACSHSDGRHSVPCCKVMCNSWSNSTEITATVAVLTGTYTTVVMTGTSLTQTANWYPVQDLQLTETLFQVKHTLQKLVVHKAYKSSSWFQRETLRWVSWFQSGEKGKKKKKKNRGNKWMAT